MKVVVASKNPVKLAAVQQAFGTYFPDETLEYSCVIVPSGVNEQPMSTEETVRGALGRARNACFSGYDYAVGIEGGLSFTAVNGTEYAFEQTWAAVIACKTSASEIASGPTFPILPNVLAHLHEGKNLKDAMAEEYGTVDLGRKEGYNGWLSKNRIDRQSASHQAVYLALCALIKDE